MFDCFNQYFVRALVFNVAYYGTIVPLKQILYKIYKPTHFFQLRYYDFFCSEIIANIDVSKINAFG